MISEYFNDTNKKHTEDQKIEFSQTRIKDLKEYIYNKLFTNSMGFISKTNTSISSLEKSSQNLNMSEETSSKWTIVYNKDFDDEKNDRFYINHNFFEQFTSEWSQTNRVKLERIDWLYLIYQVLKTPTENKPSFNVSWSNGTLGIHLDIPPVCK